MCPESVFLPKNCTCEVEVAQVCITLSIMRMAGARGVCRDHAHGIFLIQGTGSQLWQLGNHPATFPEGSAEQTLQGR